MKNRKKCSYYTYYIYYENILWLSLHSKIIIYWNYKTSSKIFTVEIRHIESGNKTFIKFNSVVSIGPYSQYISLTRFKAALQKNIEGMKKERKQTLLRVQFGLITCGIDSTGLKNHRRIESGVDRRWDDEEFDSKTSLVFIWFALLGRFLCHSWTLSRPEVKRILYCIYEKPTLNRFMRRSVNPEDGYVVNEYPKREKTVRSNWTSHVYLGKWDVLKAHPKESHSDLTKLSSCQIINPMSQPLNHVFHIFHSFFF